MKKKKRVEDENIVEMLIQMWKTEYKKDVISFLKIVIPMAILVLLFVAAYLYIAVISIYNYFL